MASRYEQGLETFKKVHGEKYYEQLLAPLRGAHPEYEQYLISSYAETWGGGEDRLDWRSREVAAISALTALGNPGEIKQHVRSSVSNGRLTREEVVELMIQLSGYLGVPLAVQGFSAALAVFEELDSADGS